MGIKTKLALAAIKDALDEQAIELSAHASELRAHTSELNDNKSRLDKLEKIVQSQAVDIAQLEDQVQNLRNRSIQSAIDRGVPTKVVAQAHGLSAGRISQIAPRKRPPLC